MAKKTVKLVTRFVATTLGHYVGSIVLPDDVEAELPEGQIFVASAPARSDQTWNGARWVYPSLHCASADGTYAGVFEEGTQPANVTPVRAAPQDANLQRWNGVNWAWLTRYFRDAEGNYMGAVGGPDIPEGWIEVSSAPLTIAARWTDGAWVEPE